MAIVITCDGCSLNQQEEVTEFGSSDPIANGSGYSLDLLNADLILRGWRANGDEHFCPDCPEPED